MSHVSTIVRWAGRIENQDIVTDWVVFLNVDLDLSFVQSSNFWDVPPMATR